MASDHPAQEGCRDDGSTLAPSANVRPRYPRQRRRGAERRERFFFCLVQGLFGSVSFPRVASPARALSLQPFSPGCIVVAVLGNRFANGGCFPAQICRFNVDAFFFHLPVAPPATTAAVQRPSRRNPTAKHQLPPPAPFRLETGAETRPEPGPRASPRLSLKSAVAATSKTPRPWSRPTPTLLRSQHRWHGRRGRRAGGERSRARATFTWLARFRLHFPVRRWLPTLHLRVVRRITNRADLRKRPRA